MPVSHLPPAGYWVTAKLGHSKGDGEGPTVSGAHSSADNWADLGSYGWRGLLAHLDEPSRAALVVAGTAVGYDTNQALLREGESGREVILLRAGRVKVVSSAPSGYEAVLAIRGPGDILGEMACIDGKPRSATVLTLEPVRGRIIPGEHFERFLRDFPAANLVVSRMLSERLRAANRRRLEYGAYPVRQRLARLLLELDGWYGRDGSLGRDIDLALSQPDLAGLVASSLESVSKAVRQLSRSGAILVRRRQLTILDKEALARVAQVVPSR
jgi:CRP/FNR family transcriptional regulator, cyclic AMP receptor protein